MPSYHLVFNLYFFQENLCLPSANIVQTDKQGKLAYPVQRATPETIVPYGLVLTPLQARLMNTVENLQPAALETRFKPTKAKTPLSLSQLLSDADARRIVESHIHRELDALLLDIQQHQLPLTLGAERRSLVSNLLLTFSPVELTPHLHFKKTLAGIEYRLRLGAGDDLWNIRERHVQPLTNTEPAWLLSGYTLYRAPGINGNMVSPFGKKDEVQVPARHVRTYFQSVIAKSARRAHIEAEGFQVEKITGFVSHLEPVENVLEKTWRLRLTFTYEGGAAFLPGDRRDRVTTVVFPDDGEEITVRQVCRNAVREAEKVLFLEKLGLKNDGKMFALPNAAPDLNTWLSWLSNQNPALTAAGFTLVLPTVEGRTISAMVGSVSLRSHVEGDWFDIQGEVKIGDLAFPFKAFLPYLRRRERYFPLPDGSFFLLPDAWFTRYADLAAALQIAGGTHLRLPKTLFTLLSVAGLDAAGFPFINPDSVDFQPPENLLATLRPYQLQGVKWLISHCQQGFGACLADDMGLGKTLQTIALLAWAKDPTPGPSPVGEGDLPSFHASPLNEQGDLPSLHASPLNEPGDLSSFHALPLNKGDLSSFHALPLDEQRDLSSFQTSPLTTGEDIPSSPVDNPSFPNLPPAPKQIPLPTRRGATGGVDLFTAHQAALNPLRALLLLPASLVFNWQRELARFAPAALPFVCAHVGPQRGKDWRALASHDVVLTTYHTARQDLDLLKKVGWRFLILDESQHIKNRQSEVSQVARALPAEHKIALSGTPIENSLADLWTLMEFINPATMGSFEQFREQFLAPIEKQGDAVVKQKPFDRVRPFILRRTKEEVAPDLPELTQQVFFTEMTTEQRRRYDQVKSAVRNDILALFNDPKTRLQALQALMRLRQLACHPVLADPEYTGDSGKFDDVMAQWEIIRAAGHKVLFFSTFEKHLQLFRQQFDKNGQPYAWLTGATQTENRPREVARFQEDPTVQAFFITLKAGGTGLNLTAADYIFLLDPWWNPAAEDQAVARAHRIGRERPVTAIRFISRDSIEEKIRDLQERKRGLGEGLFEVGSDWPNLGKEDMEALLG